MTVLDAIDLVVLVWFVLVVVMLRSLKRQGKEIMEMGREERCCRHCHTHEASR